VLKDHDTVINVKHFKTKRQRFLQWASKPFKSKPTASASKKDSNASFWRMRVGSGKVAFEQFVAKGMALKQFVFKYHSAPATASAAANAQQY
jgi:hypothetical protein